jgi:hypothetical protein
LNNFIKKIGLKGALFGRRRLKGTLRREGIGLKDVLSKRRGLKCAFRRKRYPKHSEKR